MRVFDKPKIIESVELSAISWFLAIQKKIGKSMPKWFQKSIKNVDAERNRRTLEKPANRFPWFGGGASSKSTKQVPTTAANVMKKAPKWGLKSMLNR